MTVILPEEEKSSSSLHWDDNESGFQDITEDDLTLDDDNQSKIKINLLDGNNNGTTTDEEYHLSEDEARELFGEYVSRKSCFTRAPPLKSLVFKSLRTSNIYKYVLETFVESRSTSKDCRPFNILYDSDICLSRKEALKQSAACNLWKFDVKPKRLFVDEDVRFELSDCSYVEPCSDCYGKGFSTCTNCHGYSKRMCPYCNGTGYAFSIRTSEYTTNAPYSSEYGRNETDEGNMHMWNSAYENPQLSLRPFVTHITPNFSTATGAPAFASQHPFDRVYCTYCDGMRYIYCNDCESGKVECERCQASGSVRWFIHLSVRFNTIRDEYFNRETSIPYDLIRNAVSKRVYFEQDKKIQPLWNKLFREFKLEKASSYIINEHKYQSEASHSKIISQRHSVYQIPITLCKYEYKKKPYHFWVYGFDRHVYCMNYPKKYFLFF